MGKPKKILYISSADPLKGPGAIAMVHYNALKEAGFDIDFLTQFPVKDHPDIKYVLDKPGNKYWDYIKRFPYHFLKKFRKPKNDEGPFFYFYRKETEPPLNIKKVLDKIDTGYDLIIVYFWQRLLSYDTVDKIYDKSGNNPKVYFINADYSTMTGGCHFFCSCRNFETGCGNCPMINSKNPDDFTAWNVNFRKKIVNKIKPYVSVNSYTRPFFEKSAVFRNNVTFIPGTILLDLSKFKNVPSDNIIKKYDIEAKNKFIILFGSQNFSEERKGMAYLVKALELLYNRLSPKERERILLLTIGDSKEIDSKLPDFHQKHLGYVPVSELPEIYSLANVFVSPSVNDPGPSMVNQSIACGTPVVAFEMGTAIDVIKDKESGICVPLKDTAGMAEAIEKIFKMEKNDYEKMRNTARKVAEELHSYNGFSKKIEKIINGDFD